MTDNRIDKVRAEIERRYNEYMAKDSELATIRADECLDILSFIDSMQKEFTTSVWHDASEAPEIHRKFLAKFADGKINGSWERHDDGFIPWKDVVREHKFTHWCYVEDLLKL